MTTHSVESERMSKSEYRQLITDVYSKLKELGVKDIYLSKHPAEKHSNDDFYNEIGLNAFYQDYPSELLVANNNAPRTFASIHTLGALTRAWIFCSAKSSVSHCNVRPNTSLTF